MKNAAVRTHRSDGSVLGLELGSTRIKAAVIGEDFQPIASGSYTWKSDYTDGVWTYDLAEVWTGLRAALAALDGPGEDLGHGGIRHDARVFGL